ELDVKVLERAARQRLPRGGIAHVARAVDVDIDLRRADARAGRLDRGEQVALLRGDLHGRVDRVRGLRIHREPVDVRVDITREPAGRALHRDVRVRGALVRGLDRRELHVRID